MVIPGQGYALGFEPAGLMAATEPDVTGILLRMIYRRDEQEALLERGLTAAREFFGELLRERVPKGDREGIAHRANVRLSNFMMRAALSFKDESFEDEKEWRLVTGLHPEEASSQPLLGKVDFRSGEGIVKPFLDLPATQTLETRLRVRRIVFGPTLRPNITRESLRFFLDRRGYGSVPLEGSNVPLQA